MLRESTVHTDLSEMTMSMMREKQYEAFCPSFGGTFFR